MVARPDDLVRVGAAAEDLLAERQPGGVVISVTGGLPVPSTPSVAWLIETRM